MNKSKLKIKKDEDMDFLKCHIFRLSQKKWGVTKEVCLDIYKKNKIFEYIEDNYEFIHMQGLATSVSDIEKVIKNGKG
ncbi:MAG: DUF3791 domain-containing protein [Lachnospiraceae bacterium]|nr:DUF3791 domain-containing protein [Lachnospiraceae bacterium]